MLEPLNTYRQLSYHSPAPTGQDHNTHLVHSALRRFEQALNRARLARFWAALRGYSNGLIYLGQYRLKILSSHYAGLRDVPIRNIRGSEGRACDFDDQFRPLSERSRERWISIAIARSEGTGMPPVELVQIGRDYFVRDGHHRISVAHKTGQVCIEAEITVLQVEGPLPWEQTQPAGETIPCSGTERSYHAAPGR